MHNVSSLNNIKCSVRCLYKNENNPIMATIFENLFIFDNYANQNITFFSRHQQDLYNNFTPN